MRFEKGAIYAHGSSVFDLTGPIQARYRVLGESTSALGWPVSGLQPDGDPASMPRVRSNLIDGYAELPITWSSIN